MYTIGVDFACGYTGGGYTRAEFGRIGGLNERLINWKATNPGSVQLDREDATQV